MKNVLVFSLIVFLSSFPLNAQIFRPELQLSLQEKLCQNQGKIPKTQELWQVGLYETQLDAAWVYSRSPSHPLQIAELASIAAEQALTHGHQGYSYGLCNAKVAWIISTPSASAPFKIDQDGIHSDLKVWRQHCSEIAVDFASIDHGFPKKILRQTIQSDSVLNIHPQLLPAGTLGLTCKPLDGSSSGPELWALIPVQGAESAKIPGFRTIKNNQQTLIDWIQAIRAKHGLSALKTQIPQLSKLAQQLSLNQSIRHPHKILLEQRRILGTQHIKLLGENRVKAADEQQMAWLLWSSPSHRSLLLHKNATALGIDMAHLTQEKLLVLVLAKN